MRIAKRFRYAVYLAISSVFLISLGCQLHVGELKDVDMGVSKPKLPSQDIPILPPKGDGGVEEPSQEDYETDPEMAIFGAKVVTTGEHE